MAAKKLTQSAKGGFTPAPWKPNAFRAKSVGEFLPKLMQPAFEKFGFPAAAILTDWEAIAGPELASYTAPERLKWPRRHPDETNESAKAKGATLILRVGGARALEVDCMRPQLIERINAAFGYRAVADIRILQAPLIRRETARPQKLPPTTDVPMLSGIEEERLKAALARIASAIAAKYDSKPLNAQH